MKKTKTAKKVNVKDVQKTAVKETIMNALADKGVITSGTDYGFTKDTLVLSTADCDVQIKLITPKAGVTHYELLTDDEE